MAAAQDSLYNSFPRTIEKNGKTKTRQIEHPILELRLIQKKLVRLLDRIQPPDYLHSGFRGRSYITNALQHDCTVPIAKIDIKSFFPALTQVSCIVALRTHSNAAPMSLA